MKSLLRLFLAVTSLAATAFAQQAPPEIHVTSPTTLDADWAGEPHRVYFVQWSPDLVNWEFLPVMRFGEAMHGIGANIDGAQGFFRLLHYDDVSILDLNAAQLADHDEDGVSNWEEITVHSTNPHNSDTDGDGFTDGGEIDQFTDPNDPNDKPGAEWFILTGDDEEDVVKARSRTVTIPAGMSRMIMVMVASDEYPLFTVDDQSEYNDVLTWNVRPEGYDPLVGSINVNTRHDEWVNAQIAQQEAQGFSPVHIEIVTTVTAPPDAPLTVEIDLTATNIGDYELPSSVMVAFLPIEITVAFGVGPDAPPGNSKSSRELLEEYLDENKFARQGDVWAVKGNDLQGNDKIWSVEIVTEQAKLKDALSASGRHVVYDGHSNFGLGPDFGGIPIRSINDFTNFGAGYTDVPLDFRYRGNNPNPEQDPDNWGQHGFPFIVVANNEIQASPLNYKPLPINELRFPNIDGIGDGQPFSQQGQGFEIWHYRYDADSKRLMINAPMTDLPATLGYKSFFYNVCASGIDYIENFKHGDFIYTNDTCFVNKATKIYVQGVIEGKSPAQIEPLLNQLGVGSNQPGDIIYEFNSF